MADQWVVTGMGDVVGLNLPGASDYLDRLGLFTPDVAIKIRVISEAAMAAARQRREEKANGK